MSVVILGLPVVGALLSGLYGWRLGKEGASIITTTGMFITALSSYMVLYQYIKTGAPIYVEFTPWVVVEALEVKWGFMFDSLSTIMLAVVTTVSAFVHLYSTAYMEADPHRPRFMSYLSLFTFFMILLVTADNLVIFFMGWEGVGLCSYLLVNFWHTRILANQAALKAVLVNKIGDMALLLGMLILFLVFKTLEFHSTYALVTAIQNADIVLTPFLNEKDYILVIAFCFFIGCVGKSAQLGLHTWLPDAMEGPTPVSALIHAATMVTAGVFLLLRSSFILSYTESILFLITIVGALTAFISATIGLVQNDLKRVIAYSTCSQLGYMVFACGLSQYSLSLFHLSNHAFFKALLFLGAGSVIHAVADEQDIRKMGSLVNFLPFTYTVMLIGSLALAGFPFLTGFYSKDAILETAYSIYSFDSHFAFWFGSLAALGTSFYSFRLLIIVFFSRTNLFRTVFEHLHEAPLPMLIPLFLLALASIFIGWFSRDLFIGFGTAFWDNSFFFARHALAIDFEFIPWGIKNIPTLFSFLGTVLAFLVYSIFQVPSSPRRLYRMLSKKYYFDNIYNFYLVQSFFYTAYYITLQFLDRGFFELIGPFGISSFFIRQILRLRNLNSGMLYQYAFLFILSLWLLLTFFFFSFSTLSSLPVVLLVLLFLLVATFLA